MNMLNPHLIPMIEHDLSMHMHGFAFWSVQQQHFTTLPQKSKAKQEQTKRHHSQAGHQVTLCILRVLRIPLPRDPI
eukprot:3545558-Rhodomonas_salina.1